MKSLFILRVGVGHTDQLYTLLPAQLAPELDRILVILAHEQVPFLDPVLDQLVDTAAGQQATMNTTRTVT